MTITLELGKAELQFLSSALQLTEIYQPTKFLVDTSCFRVMSWTRCGRMDGHTVFGEHTHIMNIVKTCSKKTSSATVNTWNQWLDTSRLHPTVNYVSPSLSNSGYAIGMPDNIKMCDLVLVQCLIECHMIRTNLNPMGSGPAMVLPPSGTVWESQVWTSNGTVCKVPTCGLGHCMGNSKTASLGLLWHCLRGPSMQLRGPIGAVRKTPKDPVWTSLWHLMQTRVWQYGPPMAPHF